MGESLSGINIYGNKVDFFFNLTVEGIKYLGFAYVCVRNVESDRVHTISGDITVIECRLHTI